MIPRGDNRSHSQSVELSYILVLLSCDHEVSRIFFFLVPFLSKLYLELPEIGAFSFSKEVMNEGDFAQISCIVTSGDQPLTISWSFHGSGGEGEGDGGITTTNLGTRMSMLVIEKVEHQHQGLYTCQAKNGAGSSSYTARLKVNGKASLRLRLRSLSSLEIFHFLKRSIGFVTV